MPKIALDTQAVIQACHDYLMTQHPRTAVTPQELVKAIPDFYNEARDAEIEATARSLYLRFDLKLAGWFEAVAEKVAAVDVAYAHDLLSESDTPLADEKAQQTAYALAVVFFYRAVDRGWILYGYTLSEDEAAAWLNQYGNKTLRQEVLL